MGRSGRRGVEVLVRRSALFVGVLCAPECFVRRSVCDSECFCVGVLECRGAGVSVLEFVGFVCDGIAMCYCSGVV